jgi:N-methylhydantoinase B
MTVLSKKFEMVTRDMTQTLLKSARSGVINSARDFSSAITLYDGRQFMIDEGVPIHLGNVHLTPQYTLEHFDDVSRGDCFLTNSPYAGNTHHGDYTLMVPVFYEDEPLFWSINRAHQADVGAPVPSTYVGSAENLYQEGPHFPSVRIQEDFEDKDDIVRMCKLNIRAGDRQWFGDYRAQVAAVRAGEEAIEDICDEYGVDQIKTFTEEWISYGEQMMKDEIRDLPETTIENTSYHDPIPGAPDGVPVNVKMSINPDEATIDVDLTENIPNVPCGFNLSEATTVAGVYTGIFVNMPPELPHNEGSINRINIEMDEGKIVGKPEYPVGTATATTNIASELINAVQGAFGDLGEPYGIAEGNSGVGGFEPVISGTDPRRNDDPYVNQLILAGGGAPAMHGHDGWMTYTVTSSCGIINRDSVEVDEHLYPVMIRRNEFKEDTAGDGEWRGSPSLISEYEPRYNTVTFTYFGDGHEFPLQGILDGKEGAPDVMTKIETDGEEVEVPSMIFDTLEIEPGERLISQKPGGGGYGDPTERDPEMVRKDVEAGYVSVEKARDVYGVELTGERGGLTVDHDRTASIRDAAEEEDHA